MFSGRYKSLIVDGSGTGYLKTVCGYVHLNPVRAKLLRPGQKLSSYCWSTYPTYLLPARQQPGWLRVDRPLGKHGLPMDSPAGRRQPELRLEWKPVRRGWCLGSKKFRKDLLAQMRGRTGPHHGGEERRESEEASAEKLLAEALQREGWSVRDWVERRKGDARKVRLARRLRQETTMTLSWIAKQLHMGAAGSLANLLRKTK